jgi:hypothetical protein
MMGIQSVAEQGTSGNPAQALRVPDFENPGEAVNMAWWLLYLVLSAAISSPRQQYKTQTEIIIPCFVN